MVSRREVLKEGLRWTARLGLAAEIGWFGLAAREKEDPPAESAPSSPLTPIAYDQMIHTAEDAYTPARIDTLYAFLDPLVSQSVGRQTLVRVKEYALLSGIPVELPIAILAQETGGKLAQRSSAGAIPPMHILPTTAETLEKRLQTGRKEYAAYSETYATRNLSLDDAVYTLANPALLMMRTMDMPVFDPRILAKEAQEQARNDRGWRINPPLVMLNARFGGYTEPWTGSITRLEENIKASMLYLTRLLVDVRDHVLRIRKETPSYRFPESVLAAAYNGGPGVLWGYATARRSATRVRDETGFAWAWLKRTWPGQPVIYATHVTAFTSIFRNEPDWHAWLEGLSPSYASVEKRVHHASQG